jgi:hypothetical protein
MKTYQITESELLALLKEQRDGIFKIVNKLNPHVSEWGNKLLESILNAPTPDLSNLTEVEQAVGGIDWEGFEECFYTAIRNGGLTSNTVLDWLKTTLPKYYTAPVKEQASNLKEASLPDLKEVKENFFNHFISKDINSYGLIAIWNYLEKAIVELKENDVNNNDSI